MVKLSYKHREAIFLPSDKQNCENVELYENNRW